MEREGPRGVLPTGLGGGYGGTGAAYAHSGVRHPKRPIWRWELFPLSLPALPRIRPKSARNQSWHH